VLRWVAAGRRQAEIAATLGLSTRTVENHLRHARQRLGVATTAQAVRAASRRGEIETDHGEALPAVWFACYTRHAHVRDCRKQG
jgi:predicted transcriptional regulator